MSAGEAPAFARLDGLGGSGTAAELLGEVATGARRRRAPYVLLNMVSTIDGRAALDGSTRRLGGPADLEMLLELRVLADAVLIGAGTVRAEGYGRLMRSEARRKRREAAGLAADPVAVMVSRGLDVPWDAGLFAAPDQPVLIYTSSDAPVPPTPAPVEAVVLDSLKPEVVLDDLRRRGVGILLSEGGPTLNAWMLEAGAVDELFLTLTPLLTGHTHEPTIVGGAGLPVPIDARLKWLLRHEETLFLRYGLSPEG